LSPLISAFNILLHTVHTLVKIRSHLIFNWYQSKYTLLRIYFLSVILISCDFYFFIKPFVMDFSQLSEENYDIELSKVFAILDKIVSPKVLKKVKQEKESLIIQLFESHVLIDSLRYDNTMLFDIIDTLENKLK
jgi:hypothetical protein